MLGVAFLNEIVSKPEIDNAAEILNDLREYVITSLRQTGKSGEAKDGMDISLICWFKDQNVVDFAGANNPLYLIRDGKLIEVEEAGIY